MASNIIWTFTPTSTGQTYDLLATSNPEANQVILQQRLGEVEVPRRHGVYIQATPFLSARQITLRGSIGDQVAVLRAQIDELARSLLADGRGKLKEWDSRYVWATARSFSSSYREGSGMMLADFSVDFLCDDPYWYSINTTTYNGSIPAASNLNLAVSNTDNSGHSPLSTTASTPAIFTITAGVDGMQSCSITIAGKTFSWSKNPGITNGQTVVVDMGLKDVKVNGVSDLTGLGSAAQFFDIPSGNGTIVFSHTPYTSPFTSSAAVSVVFTPRWT